MQNLDLIYKATASQNDVGVRNTSNVVNYNDVLCGRSRFAFDHPGNIILREKIANTLNKYNACNRKGKTIIIRNIANSIIRSGGRFLKFDDKKEQWYDGGFQVAKIRVSTAFRDARSNPLKRKERILKKCMVDHERQAESFKALRSSGIDFEAMEILKSLNREIPSDFNLSPFLQSTSESICDDGISFESFDTPSLIENDEMSTWSMIFEAVDLIDADGSTESSSSFFSYERDFETRVELPQHNDILGRCIQFERYVA